MSHLVLLLVAATTFATAECLGERAELQVLDTQAEAATGLIGRGRGRSMRTSGTFVVKTNGATNRAGNDEELGEANDANTESDRCAESVSDACANGKCSFLTLNAHIGRCLPKCASLFAAKSTTEYPGLPKGSTLEAWLRKDAELAQKIRENRVTLAERAGQLQKVKERMGFAIKSLRSFTSVLGQTQKVSGKALDKSVKAVRLVVQASRQLKINQRLLSSAEGGLKNLKKSNNLRLLSSSRSLQHQVETQTSQSWGSRRRRTHKKRSSGAKFQAKLNKSIQAVRQATKKITDTTKALGSSVQSLSKEQRVLRDSGRHVTKATWAMNGGVEMAKGTYKGLDRTAVDQKRILEDSTSLEALQQRLLNVEFEHAGARWDCTALDLAPRRGYVCHQKGLDSATVICKGLMLPSQGCADPKHKCLIDRPLVKQVACVKGKCEVDKVTVCQGSKEGCQSALQDVEFLTLHF